MMRTYRFDFGDDNKLYSGSFEGKLTDGDLRGILKSLHSQLYKDCPATILYYLEQHHLEYAHFETKVSLLSHEAIMKQAKILLKSRSCNCMDCITSGADIYYAVMDYQQWNRLCCEGCCYVVQRTLDRTLDSDNGSCRIVGQTYTCDLCDNNLSGFFAIRSNDQNRNLHNIADLTGEPILPYFGCVDLIGLLMEIDNLHTVEQARTAAVK